MSELGYWALPPHVPQMDPRSCWAAAMESWLAASPGRSRVIQEMLYLEMNEKPGALTADGMLTNKGIKALCATYKMGGKAFPKNKLKSLTGKFLMDRLVKKRYLWMAYDYPNLPGHVVVIYGMVNEPGNEVVLAMDPMDAKAFTNYPLEDYKYGARQFFVAWSLYGINECGLVRFLSIKSPADVLSCEGICYSLRNGFALNPAAAGKRTRMI